MCCTKCTEVQKPRGGDDQTPANYASAGACSRFRSIGAGAQRLKFRRNRSASRGLDCLERMTPLAPAVAARSPRSGSALPATKAARHGRFAGEGLLNCLRALWSFSTSATGLSAGTPSGYVSAIVIS